MTIELTGLLLVLEIIALPFSFAKMLMHILAPFMFNGPSKVAQLSPVDPNTKYVMGMPL